MRARDFDEQRDYQPGKTTTAAAICAPRTQDNDPERDRSRRYGQARSWSLSAILTTRALG